MLFLWPLSSRPFDTVAYLGDSLATVYFMAENGRRLFSSPGSLFEAGIAFPHPSAALFEAHRLLLAALGAPVIALSGNPILAANLVGLLAYAFNAWGAWRLALALGISPISAFGAGALFAFNTYAVLEQPRLNIILLGFIPLALVEVMTFVRTGESRHAWRCAWLWLLQAYTENYSAIYGGAVIVLVFAIALFHGAPPGTRGQRARTAAAAGLLASVAFSPVVLAYVNMDAIYDFRREAPYSLDLSHFFATQPGNFLYGKIGPPVRPQQQGAHFVGFGALLLGLVGFFSGKRRGASRDWSLLAGLIAVALGMLAAGRSINLEGHQLMPGPYGWLYDHVSLFERTRIPERFGLLMMLPVSLLAARGVDLVGRDRRVLRIALAALLPLEHAQRFPWTEVLPTGSDLPAVYTWLRDSDAKAVVETPAHGEGLVRMESVDMYFQLFHHKPIVSAYLSFPPLLTRLLRQASEEFPDESALKTLALTGVDTVVYHQEAPSLPPEWAEAVAAGRLVPRATFARPAYWLRPAGLDLVFSIPKPPASIRSDRPRTVPVRSKRWRYRASEGQARLAADGDRDTQWVIEDPIKGGESFEIGFGDETVPIRALALPLTRRDILPTAFDIDTRDARGEWSHFATYGPAERDELIADLIASPGAAVLTLQGSPVDATGVRMVARPRARSFDGWRLSEVEVRVGLGGLK